MKLKIITTTILLTTINISNAQSPIDTIKVEQKTNVSTKTNSKNNKTTQKLNPNNNKASQTQKKKKQAPYSLPWASKQS